MPGFTDTTNAPSREWQSSRQATARARLCIHRREGGRLCQKLHTIRTQLSVFPKKQPAHSLLSSLSVSARLLLSSFCLQGSGSFRNGLIYSDGLSKASSGADGGKHRSSSAPANTPQDGSLTPHAFLLHLRLTFAYYPVCARCFFCLVFVECDASVVTSRSECAGIGVRTISPAFA